MSREELVALVNTRLGELMADSSIERRLEEAMSYSVNAGGKRLRPTLCLMANQMLGGNIGECLDLACAIEMIHTYSLVHDDLPAMDNDDLRRGRPTCHAVYGEAMAILAGDGLLSYAFFVMLQNAARHPANLVRHNAAMFFVAVGAGTDGMVAGQALDVAEEGSQLDAEDVQAIELLKTGSLLQASVTSGAALAGASTQQIGALEAYGGKLGLAFQIVDDVLDVTSSPEILGKTPGKDAEQDKITFVSLYGVDKAREMAAEATAEAVASLELFGSRADPLQDLTMQILHRDR